MARQRFQRGARKITNRSWAVSAPASGATVAAATKVLIGGFTLSNAGIDETVLRVVGSIAVRSDQFAASEDQFGAFGMIVVSDVARTTGITAIPSPITDGSDDGWFVYQGFSQRTNFLDATGNNTNYMVSYDFDSKAKRIIQDGFGVALVVENAHATHGFTVRVQLRMLSMVRGT